MYDTRNRDTENGIVTQRDTAEKMKLMELQLKPSEEPPDISPDDPATGAIAQT